MFGAKSKFACNIYLASTIKSVWLKPCPSGSWGLTWGETSDTKEWEILNT